MPRRRRSSDSTVATIDEDEIVYSPETAVVRKPNEEEAAAYECIVLEDATVYDKHGEVANLLTVHSKGPFTVRGLARIDEDQRSDIFLKRSTRSAYVEIQNCGRYSVGLADEHQRVPTVWAEGAYWWYEIRPPSARYASTYDEIAEAISLYYNMLEALDQYETEQYKQHEKQKRKHKKGKKSSLSPPLGRDEILKTLDVSDMFLKFAAYAGDGCCIEEVYEACDKHVFFLLSQFYDEPNYDWFQTPFFKWLAARHPKTNAKVIAEQKKKQRLMKGAAGPAAQGPQQAPALVEDPLPQKTVSKTTRGSQPKSSSPAPQTVDKTQSRDFALRVRSSRSVSKDPKAVDSPVPSFNAPDVMEVDPPQTEAHAAHTQQAPPTSRRSPAELVAAAIEAIRLSHNKPAYTLAFKNVRAKLYVKHRVKNYEACTELISYFAPDILSCLDAQDWAGSEFYAELQILAAQPRPLLTVIDPDNVEHYMTFRNSRSSNAGSVATPPAPTAQHNAAPSVLETPPPRARGRPAGKSSGLRPKRHIPFDENEGPTRGFKSAKLAHFYDIEDDEEENSMDVDTNDKNSDLSDDTENANEGTEPVKVVIRAEKMPDLSPKGPNGTWVCDQDDNCDFIEHEPRIDAGKKRIEQHLRELHLDDQGDDGGDEEGEDEDEDEDEDETEEADDAEDKLGMINLAKMEGGRGHLPVDHLLEKIRSMGEKQQTTQKVIVNGQTGPQPIKRRMLI